MAGSGDVPPAPDYTAKSCWAAAGTPDQVVPDGVTNSAEQPADVFYVHPTSYFGPTWNAHWDDAPASVQVDELQVRVQTTPFSGICRVFAPRYRQMTYAGFVTEDTASARSAAALAYADVARAFDTFLDQYNEGRPFFLASHSQGTVHATRLLRSRIDPDPVLANRCVAAYLLGMCIPTSFADSFERFTPSTGPDQLHSLISWNLRTAATDGSLNYLSRDVGPGLWTPGGTVGGEGPLLQVSPLTWRSHHLAADNHSKEASPHLGVGLPVYEPGFAPLAVFDGSFASKLAKIKRAPRQLTAETTEFEVVVGGKLNPKLFTADLGQGVGDLHTMDCTLFLYNHRENVERRLRAFLERPRARL